jgi:hypothetical protein
MEYLCVIVDCETKKTLAEYEISANQEPMARWKAKKLFRETNPAVNVDWEVDALKLD